ncbi:MAG: hypothetical protein ACLQMH_15270 [Solirubrobacteraceae bacterium]
MSTAEELAAMIDLARCAVEDARAHEHTAGLANHHTRKLPGDCLRILRRWRSATAVASGHATVQLVVANGTVRKQAASADKQANVCTEEPPVPAATTTSIRIPESLRERVEEYGREHRWSMGEVTRVALEQLVGYDRDEAATAGAQSVTTRG